MFRSIVCASLVFLVFGVQIPAGKAVGADDLSKRQLKELESVFAPAYAMGNTPVMLESLGKVVSRMTDKQIEELDSLFAQRGIPAASTLLVNARLQLLQQGFKKGLKRPTNRELVLMLEHIDNVTTELVENLDEHANSIAKLNNDNSFEEYESLLWDSHVLRNQLTSGRTLAQYAAETVNKTKRIKLDELEPKQRSLLEKDFAQIDQTLAAFQKNLSEHELATRIKRIDLANFTLGQPTELKERYKAAWSIDVDGRLIQDELGNDEVEFELPFLKNPELFATVTKQLEHGRLAAGDELLKKSSLLGTGLHWWMRGRYGMGSDGFGLLKSWAALSSSESEFALYMPQSPPTPSDPSVSDGYNVPEIDRRHNYIWAWEYREVQSSTQSYTTNSQQRRVATSETKLSRFY